MTALICVAMMKGCTCHSEIILLPFDVSGIALMKNSVAASSFPLGDASGKEAARDRWLKRDEPVQLFETMRVTIGFGIEKFLPFIAGSTKTITH